jgi:predicted exporter
MIKMKSWYRILGITWLLTMIGLATFCVQALVSHDKVQFDILALLPKSQTKGSELAQQFMEDAQLSRQLIVLIGHNDPGKAKLALNELRQGLGRVSLPIEEKSTATIASEYQNLFRELFHYRAGLLTKADRDILEKDEGSSLVTRTMTNLSMPFSPFSPSQLRQDPFFLFPTFVQSMTPASELSPDESGDLHAKNNGKTWYLFKAQLSESAFSMKVQEDICALLYPMFEEIQAAHGVEILKTGAIFYATAGAQLAQNEISFISLISILGIVLLLVGIFRSWRPLLLSLTVIGSGIVGGLAVCLWIFGSVHILALVFGCSLVGVTVDYALHYYCAAYGKNPSPEKFWILQSLMPAMLLGVLSSALGYGLLVFVPFPGIQQMAVLASVGLLSAFISVCLWGTYFVHTQKQMSGLGQGAQRALEWMATLGQTKHLRSSISMVLVIVFASGSYFLAFEDNVQTFQSLDVQLKSEEDQVRTLMAIDQSSKFLIVTGTTTEEVLQTEEQLIKDLESFKVTQDLKGYRAIGSLIPSCKGQQENRQLVETKLYDAQLPALKANLDPLHHDFDGGLDSPLLSLDGLKDKLPEGWRELIHVSDNGGTVGRIVLDQVKNDDAMQALSTKYPGVLYVDITKEYSQIFGVYRQIVLFLIAGILCGILLFLMIKESVFSAIKVIGPVALSIMTSIAMLSIWGIPLSVFHAMGLLLVVCIGIDYAFFLYYRKKAAEDYHLLGNGLAAITTILSFGLLALSQTNAVHSFGISVFIGISLCFCITTLFLGNRGTNS